MIEMKGVMEEVERELREMGREVTVMEGEIVKGMVREVGIEMVMKRTIIPFYRL